MDSPKIVVRYWAGGNFMSETSFRNGEEFPTGELSYLVNELVPTGLHILIRPRENGDIDLWIDNKMFSQR